MNRIFTLLLTLLLFCPFSALHAQLAGQYTVDGSKPASAANYQSVRAAVVDMHKGTRPDGGPVNGPGVSAAVDISIAPGTHPWDSIPAISGASTSNTIHFHGAAGDSHSVQITKKLVLYQAKCIEVSHLRLTAGIDLVDGCSDIHIHNCHITSGISSNADRIQDSYWGSLGTGDNSNYITINDNYIRGFARPAVFMKGQAPGSDGGATGYPAEGIVVRNNVMDSCNGFTVRFRHCGAVIEGNRIRALNGYAVNIGGYEETYINRNFISSLQNGLLAESSDARLYIFNNRLHSASAGIDVKDALGGSSAYVYIYHNTVLSDNEAALLAPASKDKEVYNNIFETRSTGVAADYGGNEFNIDYNIYYTQGVDIIESNGKHADFTTLRGINPGFELHGYIADPKLDAKLLLTGSPVADRAALVVKGYPRLERDHSGQLRDTITPDIGADEIDLKLYTNNVRLLEIAHPAEDVCAATDTVKVRIRNDGAATLTSASIDWTVNGNPMPQYAWSGSLNTGDTSALITLGPVTFSKGVAYAVRVWTSGPNMALDSNRAGDTLQKYMAVWSLPPIKLFTDTTYCQNDTSTFSMPIPAGYKIKWTSQNAAILTGQNGGNLTIHWSGAGMAELQAVITNPAGCMDSVSQLFIVHPQPKPYFSIQRLDTLTRDYSFSTSDSMIFYSWDFGDGDYSVSRADTHTFAQNGTYHIKLRLINKEGCQADADTTITVFLDTSSHNSIAPQAAIAPLKLFPNPVYRGTASISLLTKGLSLQDNALLMCTDVTGREIFSTRLKATGAPQLRIPLPAGLLPGLYLLKISSGPDIYTGRLVVE